MKKLNILIVEGNLKEENQNFLKVGIQTHTESLKDRSFDGFLKWILDLREKFEIPHKLSSVINEKDLQIDRLSKMALEDPSTNGNPKKLSIEDMKIMYQHSMSGNLF